MIMNKTSSNSIFLRRDLIQKFDFVNVFVMF